MSALAGRALPVTRRSVGHTTRKSTLKRVHNVLVRSVRDANANEENDGDDKSSDNKSPDTELIDARIRAERLAVRLKLRSVGGQSPSAMTKTKSQKSKSLDAAIAETKMNSKNAGSTSSDPSTISNESIDDERNAVRTRLERFSMNRYAFVSRGELKGNVIDRVTGEAAPNEDNATSSIDDRVDLARERVKQAQQEVMNLKNEFAIKTKELERSLREAEAVLDKKQKTLSTLATALTLEKSKNNSERDLKSEERRAVLKTLDVMDDTSLASAVPGSRARKSATASTPMVASNDTSANDQVLDAKTRAQDAIRARASSSLSRLRKQRKIKRASSARNKVSTATTNSTVDGKEIYPVEESNNIAALGGVGSCELTDFCDVTYDREHSLDEHDTVPGLEPSGSVTSTPGSSSIPKPIFVLSDCTGESAANTCRAALNQFAEVMNLSAPTNLYVFRFLSEGGDVYKIVKQAGEDDALVVYTLSDAAMATAVQTACNVYGVKSVNLWGPLLVAMESHLAMQRIGVPMSFGRSLSTSTSVVGVGGDTSSNAQMSMNRHSDSELLSTDYYKMIEAVEFTRRMDDGANPNQWKDCDILIIGVSRTGKTPLSIYLGQRGYKVANLPLVPRDEQLLVPKYIEEVDPKRVFGLLISSEVLHSIRKNRIDNIGVGKDDKNAKDNYSAMRQVNQELALAKALYAQHPNWQVLDVTHKGVEETAARIMKLMYQSEDANAYTKMKAT